MVRAGPRSVVASSGAKHLSCTIRVYRVRERERERDRERREGCAKFRIMHIFVCIQLCSLARIPKIQQRS